MTKTKLLCAGVAGGLMLGSVTLGTAFAKPAPKTPELSNLKDATWTPLMKEGGPLPATAAIQGDANKGAYTGYLKLPAGFESPPHSHTNDYWSVLVQGKMTHWAVTGGSEKDAKQLAVGDLTFMPGKVEHISKCYPGADCIMVIVQKGKSDFIPAKAVAKKEEKPAAATGTTATAEKKEEKPAAAPAATAAKKEEKPAAAAPAATAVKKEEKPAVTPATGSEKSGPATAAAPAAAAPAKAPAAAPVAPAAAPAKAPAAAPAAAPAKTPASAPAATAPAAAPAAPAAPAKK